MYCERRFFYFFNTILIVSIISKGFCQNQNQNLNPITVQVEEIKFPAQNIGEDFVRRTDCREEFKPFLASIVVMMERDDIDEDRKKRKNFKIENFYLESVCSGLIISERHVLTVKDCRSVTDIYNQHRQQYVVYGGRNLSEWNDLEFPAYKIHWIRGFEEFTDPTVFEREKDDYYDDDDEQIKDKSLELVVYQLDKKEYGIASMPRLPFGEHIDAGGGNPFHGIRTKECYQLGYGWKLGDRKEIPKEFYMPLISFQFCRLMDPYFNEQKLFCAGQLKPWLKDVDVETIGDNDFGGPLFCKVDGNTFEPCSEDGWVAIGIANRIVKTDPRYKLQFGYNYFISLKYYANYIKYELDQYHIYNKTSKELRDGYYDIIKQ